MRELKSYNKPPYKVLSIVASLFILVEVEGLDAFVGKLYRIPEEGSANLAQLWKTVRASWEINKILKDMSELKQPDLDRARAVAAILANISDKDATQASKAVGELRKWCIIKSGLQHVMSMPEAADVSP